MKKTLVTIILSLVLYNLSFSQSIKILGTYVDNTGDTINCRFKFPKNKKTNKIDFSEIKYKIKARQILTDKKVKLRPSEIKSFEFGYNYQHYLFQSVDNQLTLRGDKIFLENIIDGDIKLYKFYRKIVIPLGGYNAQTGTTSNSSLSIRYFRYCMQKHGGQLYKLNKDFIKTTFVDLISDCPKFTNSSASSYGYNNIYSVVTDYNNCNKD